MVRRFVRFLFCSVFHLLFFLLSRLDVQGKEYIPNHGGYITAANHLSVIEVPLVYCLLSRDDATGLVAKKHQKNRSFKILDTLIKKGASVTISKENLEAAGIKDHELINGVIVSDKPYADLVDLVMEKWRQVMTI